MTGPGQAVVDTALGLGVGQRFSVARSSFTVVGVVAERTLFGGVANAYVTLADVQGVVFGGRPLIGAVLVTGTPDQRARPGYALHDEQPRSRRPASPRCRPASPPSTTRGYFMWVIAAIIVAALVYVTALERTRDFAVLKAVGASTACCFAGLAAQAVMVSLVAAVIGAVLSTFMTGIFPQPVYIPAAPTSSCPCRPWSWAAGQPGRPATRRLGRSGRGLRGGMMAELEVRDLTVEFDSGGYKVRPLDDLSFDAEDGELVVVLGPSGCGKTTLLSCLAGLLTPTSGSIRFRGHGRDQPGRARARRATGGRRWGWCSRRST